MMFVDKIQKLCLRRCDNGPEGNPRDLTRWNHQVISEREDRVENGPDRVRKWSAIPKGSRRADSPPPTHDTSPVGLVLRIGGDPARSEERRVGKGCVRTSRSRGAADQ